MSIMSSKPVITTAIDAVAGVAIFAAWMDYLPMAATLLGAAWYLIQIYESRTIQGWLGRWSKWWASHRAQKTGGDVVVLDKPTVTVEVKVDAPKEG